MHQHLVILHCRGGKMMIPRRRINRCFFSTEKRPERRHESVFYRVEKYKPNISLCRPPALKMKIKEVKKEKGDRKLIAAQKKKKVLKLGVLRKKDLKKLTLYIKNGANCPCSQLDSLGSNFLIMGRKVDQQLLLMSIHKWDKKSKELKFAIKYMKSHQCPTYHTVFQWHSPHGCLHLNPAPV